MRAHVFHTSGLVVGDGPSLLDAAVVVDDTGLVLDVGSASEVLPRSTGADVTRIDGVAFPGLVNAHTHLELSSLAKSAPPGLGFAAWAKKMLGKRMKTTAARAEKATADAVDALVRFGTVAVGDVGNGLSSATHLYRAGIRGALFHEVFGSVLEAAMARVEAMKVEASKHASSFEGGLVWSPSAHTLHTTHPDAVRTLVALARSRGARSSIHLAEHAAEREALEHGTGAMITFLAAMGVPEGAFVWPRLGPIAYAESLSLLADDVVLVHLTDATSAELETIAAKNANVVLCPRSNQWIEGRSPNLPAMLRAGLAPALGTDSLASCASLDVLEEARELKSRFPETSADTLLQMATWNGACALGISEIGRVAKGARPGLFAVDGHGPGSASEVLLASVGAPRRRLDRVSRGRSDTVPPRRLDENQPCQPDERKETV